MSKTPEDLRGQIEESIIGLGFAIVEFHTSVVNGRTHVNLVVHSPHGVSIDDCTLVHKTVLPRLELVLDNRDVALQVASPGIERTFKDNAEFAVFKGKGVRVLSAKSNDWVGGVIVNVDTSGVELETVSGVVDIAFADIQKAKLDYSQEVR